MNVDQIYMAFVALVALIAMLDNWRLSVALLVSLLSAIGLDAVGRPEFHAHAMFLCAMLVISNFTGWRFHYLEIEGNEINYAVAFVYMLRLFVDGLFVLGLIGQDAMWLLSSGLLLTVQIMLTLGGCLGGYTRRINRAFNPFIRSMFGFIVPR